MLLLEHVSKIVSVLLSKLSDCPNTDTLLCYYNYPFLTVHKNLDAWVYWQPTYYIHHAVINAIRVFPLRLGCAWLYYGIVLLTTTLLQYDPHCRKSPALLSLCWFVKPVVPAYRCVVVQSLFDLLYLVPIGSVWMCCWTVVITSELVRILSAYVLVSTWMLVTRIQVCVQRQM